jgi:hypothetical protein
MHLARHPAAYALLALVGCSGCLSWLHPIRPPEDCCNPALPCAAKQHVYIFLIHGVDPLNYANLSGVRDYCIDLGYNNTYYGMLYHGRTFEQEIRRIHADDPQARFVLLGFSAGANVARSLCQRLQDDPSLQLDLLIYTGGNTLENEPSSRPENVIKVVHILATGYVWKGTSLAGAENYKYTKTWHFGSPTHPETLRLLTRELTAVACRVGIPVSAEPPGTEPNTLPAPRPLPAAGRDEWDFLKPAAFLAPPSQPARGLDRGPQTQLTTAVKR